MAQALLPLSPNSPVSSSPPRTMTYEEFLAREDEFNAAEWVDGEIIHLTVTTEHNDLNDSLLEVIKYYARRKIWVVFFENRFR
jgi:hypothetical protein